MRALKTALVLLTLFSTPLVAQTRLDDDVRALMRAGKNDEALKRLGFTGALPPLLTLPGLLGSLLQSEGEHLLACRVYELDEKAHPERAEVTRLRSARCLSAQKKPEAKSMWQRVLESEQKDGGLEQNPALIQEAAKALNDIDPALYLPTLEKHALPFKAPKDIAQRQALSSMLFDLAKSKSPLAKRAAERLYLELGETAEAKKVFKLKSFDRGLIKDVTKGLERARVLSAQHQNRDVVNTLKALPLGKPSATNLNACEANYLLGKAARKTRKYKTARYHLDAVSKKCSGDFQKRARYLAAQVATFQGSRNAHSLYDAFVKTYPEDGLSDDVLVFKAKRFTAQKKLKEAEATYQRLVDDYPQGDMAEHARFNLAFTRAKRGDINAARAVLEVLARNAEDPNTQDRALYWRARLLAYPTLASLTLTQSAGVKESGLKELAALANARPTSFYGNMARLVVKSAGASEAVDKIAVTKRPAQLAQSALEHPVFKRAAALANAGYDAEAAAYLTQNEAALLEDEGEKDSSATLLALAQLYARVGGASRGHQVLRFSGHAQLHGKPEPTSIGLWSVNYPRAHAAAITAGANAVSIPPELLMGLAREESAFNEKVISWAGAIGLCQLMPFTAKEEAQILRKGVPSLEDLRVPELNARLGANHLARRMSLGHPLLAIGAYNAGPGNIAKWRRGFAKGSPLDAFLESIPVEQTRKYIQKVTGSWLVYQALDGEGAGIDFALTLP